MALDLATNLGWAVGRLPKHPRTQLEAAMRPMKKPLSGTHRVAEPGTSVGPFLSAFERWLGDMIKQHDPGGIIFEAPILPRETTPRTARKLIGLAAVTQKVAHDHRIQWVREAQPSAVKKHICGNGGPGKEGVKRAILQRGWIFADDNEADALALHDLAGWLFHKERAAA